VGVIEGYTGLSEEEAQKRLATRGPTPKRATGRSYASIVRHNVFTLPNTVLGFFGIVTVALGELADAIFLGIVVANALIGCVQEIRAKRALERLAALVKPTAQVVRDGNAREVDVAELVPGDLVLLEPGDQVVADGEVVAAESLRVDESILTGESEPIGRSPGEPVLSGSFAVEGTGAYAVEAVGAESYAERLAGEARAFRHPPSPFQIGLNHLIVTLVVLGVPLVGSLALALWLRETPFDEALPTVVAAAINIIPEGLILLSSLVYLSGALKLSRRGALTQQLNAIESLASADVVCFDKTGTLTESRLRVAGLAPAAGVTEEELGLALGRFAAAFPSPNSTLQALAAAFPGKQQEPVARIPFSSRWKWSAVQLDSDGYLLGAPELFALGTLGARAASEAGAGRRVVALAATATPLAQVDPASDPLPEARPLGLAVLAEELRPDAQTTVEYFGQEDIRLLVLSGDAPATVAAIAQDAGIPVAGVVDGRRLPADDAELLRLIGGGAVVGRIDPEGKRRTVEALRESGRYVAMVGDGVNDVPALKASRIAIAQGSGAQMARTVADIVLVRGSFDAVPRLVAEGRQILRNMQRVSKIYTTKCVFGAFTVVALGLAPIPYPFLPRHLSFASFFVTGVPPFFLALAPSSGPWRMTSFLRDVLRFAVPAAAALTVGVGAGYALALEGLELEVDAARTVATTVFVVASLYMIFCLEATDRGRARWVGAMCLILIAGYIVALAIPPLREFFRLVPSGAEGIGCIALGLALAVAGLVGDRASHADRVVEA
jgi:magnesium-transporting ATPase (P-type)